MSPQPPELLLRELPNAVHDADPVGRAISTLRQGDEVPGEVSEIWLAALPPRPMTDDPVGAALQALRCEGRNTAPVQKRPRWARLAFPVSLGLAVSAATAALLLMVQPQSSTRPVTQASSVSPPRVQVPARRPPPTPIVRVAGDALVDRDGKEVSLGEGDPVAPGDAIKTGGKKRLVLAMGPHEQVAVDPNSEIRIGAEPSGRLSVVLRAGRIEGRAQGTGRGLRIRSGDAAVAVLNGQAGVLRTPSGRLSVAALRESVVLLVNHRQVTLRPGHQIRLGISAGRPTPEPIPPTLAVKLRQVSPLRTPGAGKIMIMGTSDPDVLVVVQGAPVTVAEDGRFVAEIPVSRRTRQLAVRVVDAAGRVQAQKHVVQRITARWRWRKKG